MGTIFSLAWQGVRYRKGMSALLACAVGVAVACLVLIGLAGNSALYSYDQQAKDQYGEQMVVVPNADEAVRETVRSDPAWTRCGIMTTAGFSAAAQGGMPVALGCLDGIALTQSRIRLSVGRLPQSDHEIAVEAAVFGRLGRAAPLEPGDSLTLPVIPAGAETAADRTYTVVGILDNYTAAWRANLDFTGEATLSPPSVLLTEAAAAALSGSPLTALLLDTSITDYSSLQPHVKALPAYAINEAAYPRLNAVSLFYDTTPDEHMNVMALVAIIGGTLLASIALIILNAFSLSVGMRRRQIALLRCVGTTRKQTMLIILCETLLLCALGIVPGLAAGTLLSAGLTGLIGRLAGIPITFRFRALVPVLAALAGLIIALLAAVFPAVRAAGTPPVAGMAGEKSRRRTKRRGGSRTPLGLALGSLWRHKWKTAGAVLSFVFCVLLFNMMLLTDRMDNAPLSYRVADVSFSPSSNNGGQTGLFFTADNQSEGVPADIVAKSKTATRTDMVRAVISPYFYLLLDEARYDDYLNERYFYDPARAGYPDYWRQYEYTEQLTYGYSDKEYLHVPAIRVYDDDALKWLRPYVVEGNLDIDAVREGREVILYTPDYAQERTVRDDGMETKGYWGTNLSDKPEHLPVYRNTTYRAGDTLTFSALTGDIISQYPLEAENVERTDHTVIIGAVLRELPWLFEYGGDPLGIIAGTGAPESWGLPYDYAGVNVYLPDDADIPQAEQELRAMAAAYDGMRMDTATEWAAVQRQEWQFKLAVTALLTVTVGGIGLLGLVNALSGRILARRRELAMLRAVGLTKGQAMRMFIYEGTAVGLIAGLIGSAVFLSICYTQMEAFVWKPFFSLPLLVISIAACMVFGLLSVLFPTCRVLNGVIVEDIRMLV